MINWHYTRREKQVLTLLSEGLNNIEMAATLGVHPQTISTRATELYAKTGAVNREELFKIACRWRAMRLDVA